MTRDTREKIIEAGMALFSEHGFAGVTTKKIAESAGISEVTLYRHFESKRSLFNIIVKERMLDFGVERYLKEAAELNVEKDLLNIAHMFMNTYKKNKALHLMVLKDKFLKSEARTHSKKIENKDMKALKEYFIALKEQGIIKDDPEKIMRLYLSNIHGFVLHSIVLHSHPKKDAKKLLEYFDWMIKKITKLILM